MPTFAELIKGLPSGFPRVGLVPDLPVGVGYVETTREDFIPPDLDVVREDDTPAIVLVSAPAAVGKSMLAREVAVRTGGVLWDLAQFHVGSNFLVGTIASTHGFAKTGDVMSAMGAARFLVVMDALDEAEVRAGEANLFAFAENLAQVLGDLRSPSPTVVLLARAETAQLTELILEDAGLPLRHLAISYFGRDQAIEFLDGKLDRLEHRAHRQFRTPYVEARDLLFSKVFQVLGVATDDWEDDEARAFLGYSPVLEALAQYLDQPNYAGLQDEIEDSFAKAGAADDGGMWRFLQGIVEDVLDREQHKLRRNLPAGVEAGLRDAGKLDAVYSPEEQCDRLVARVLRQPPPDLVLPGPVRDDYEKVVASFFDQHPFVGHGANSPSFANVVFRDYVYARALVRGSARYRDQVRALLGDAAFRPSPMLARFLLRLAAENGDETRLAMDDFPIFYASVRAEDAATNSVGLAIVEDDHALTVQVDSAAGERIDLVLNIEAGRPLEVWDRLANAAISLDSLGLAIGRPGDTFTLGPAASIRCRELVVRSADIRIDTRDAVESAVLIVAQSIAPEAGEQRIEQLGPHPLKLVCDGGAAYPWVQYLVQAPPAERGTDVTEALTDLRNIITWFRSQGYGGLGMRTKGLDTAAAKGRVSADLLQYSIKRGLITREDKLYKLHPAEFKISLPEVKARIASPEVREFLLGFLEERSASS